MRRKVIVEIDENYNVYDSNGTLFATALSTNTFEPVPNVDIAQLVGLGVEPDDLIKLKAAGLLS